MGFFDLFKKSETCARCNATVAASDLKTLNGRKLCPSCYRRLQSVVGGASQGASQGRQTGGSGGASNNGDKFGDKYGDKYGKGSGSSGSTGSSGSAGRSTGYSSGSSGKSTGGCPAAIADIKRVLDETKTKYREESNGRQWEIVTGFTGKEKNYLIKFISTGSNDDTLAMRIFGIVSVERSQYSRVYPVLNKLQDTYRFLRFTLDGDGDVNVEYDLTCCDKDAGLVALELIVRITKILDDAYPELKRAAYL